MRQRTRVRLNGLVACLMVGAVGAVLVVSGTAVAGKPDSSGKGRGGKANFGVCVTFDDSLLDRIQSDDGTPYCDGVDKVMAIAGDGFRLDTLQKTPRKGEPRKLSFDLNAYDSLGPNPNLPMFPGLDPLAGLARVDMRIGEQYYSDSSGQLLDGDPADPNSQIVTNAERVSASLRLDLRTVAPGATARASLSIKFVFVNDLGVEETWILGFAGSVSPDARPVWVTAFDLVDADGVSDSWYISTGTATETEPNEDLARLWEGTEGNPSGYFHTPFAISVESQ